MTISALLLFAIGHVVISSVFGNIQHTCHLNCHHGHCHILSSGHRFCKCVDGWLGDHCDIDTCHLNCHHGHCHILSSGHRFCKCVDGWLGDHCDIEDKCRPNPCQHGGICNLTDHKPYFRCDCINNHLGQTCKEDHCTSAPCKNDGVCVPKHHHVLKLYECKCPHGFDGRDCQDKIQVNVDVMTTLAPKIVNHTDACAPNPCHHHGRCHHINHSPFFRCQCINAFIGELCKDNHCSSSPCQNNGTCHHDKHDLFHCRCPDDYHGNLCQMKTSTMKAIINSTLTTATHVTQTMDKTSDSVTSVPVEYTHASTDRHPSANHTCDKYNSVFGVAEKVTEINQNASTCTSGRHSSPDAYVLAHCDVNSTSSWKQGVKVMNNCDNIPSYTPIAAFDNGIFVPDSCFSGVFLGCLNNVTGIKMIIQRCDEDPAIVHITSGQFNFNPFSYFTIV